MSEERINPWEEQLKVIKEVSDIMGLEPAFYEVVSRPKAILHVSLPIRMDDGSVKVFEAFRIHHNDARGPVSYTHLTLPTTERV